MRVLQPVEMSGYSLRTEKLTGELTKRLYTRDDESLVLRDLWPQL